MPGSMLPFAFLQFGSLGMLLWGLAAALPLLIHLWSRRRYREETWAAMTFLLAALRKNSRRIQIEQWILLAVRMALLVLFALALADPHLSVVASWVGPALTGQTHLMLVIDGSYSMDFRAANQSRFSAAKQLASQLVRSGAQGDGYTLVLMSAAPRAIIPQPAFATEDVLVELNGLQLPHSGAGLTATLAEVEAVLRRAIDRHPRLMRHRVIFLSDLQQATWQEAVTADGRARLARLEELASLELVDLGQPGDQNLAVARLDVDQPLVAIRNVVQIRTEIQSYARDDRPRQSVEVLVDGHRVADERVDVPAGGRAALAIPYRFETPGEHLVEVRLADDALPLDNQRWLSINVRSAVRILCVGGRPAETRHLALALEPWQQSDTALEITEAPESRIVEGDLAPYDCVFLVNVGRISPDEAGVLQRYVSRGGGLVIFLGDQVQPASYNQLAEDSPMRLLPAQLTETAPRGTYAFQPLDYRHSIVAPFRGHERSGLLTTPVWKYVRVAPTPQATVALEFDTGDPAIVEHRVGQGRCVLVATAASPESTDTSTDPPTPWTALSSWPSFPPLVHEILRFAVAGRSEVRNVQVGDELVGVIPLSALDQPIELIEPEGTRERLPIASSGADLRWSYAGTSRSGPYEVHLGQVVQRFAVNVDASEGDLTRFDPELLPAQLHPEPMSVDEGTPELAVGETTSYFRFLLAGVFALLLVEPLLAWRFGRGRA